MVTRKEQILQALASLPDDAPIEEAIERLDVLAAIERGMRQIAAGEGIPHKAAKRRLAKTNKPSRSNLLDEPFVGLWRDREDMSDSSAWVRKVRRDEWAG